MNHGILCHNVRIALIGCTFLALASCGGPTVAQAADSLAWEWLPYRVVIESQIEPSPQLSTDFLAGMWNRVELRLYDRLATAWNTTIDRATATEPATIDERRTETADKRFVVRIEFESGRYRISVRESDAITGTTSSLVERRTVQREMLDERLVEAILAAFRPTVLIDDVRGRSARLRFRAGGLLPAGELQRLAEANPTYQPFLRRIDRDGRLQRIDDVPWTFATIDEMQDAVALATIVSGRSSPFGGTKRGRSERVGISVGRPTGSTTLSVVGRDGGPLPGARVVCDDGRSKGGSSVPRDDRGCFTLVAADGRPQTIVVTSRFLPLAKVPIVPGLVAELSLPVAADASLFTAEERLLQWQSKFLDLHVRRRVLLMLASSYLDQAKPDSARALLAVLDQGEKPAERIVELESLGRRLTTDASASKRSVDRMIVDAATAARELDDSDFAAEVRGKLKQAAAK